MRRTEQEQEGKSKREQERKEGASSPLYRVSDIPGNPGNCGAELRQNAHRYHISAVSYSPGSYEK